MLECSITSCTGRDDLLNASFFNNFNIQPHIQTSSGRAIPVIGETVGQFIDLKDMGGLEIYEGDVVECETSNGLLRFSVFWLDGLGAWGLMPEGKILRKGEFLFSTGADLLEIIGNIYEGEVKP